jgi:hypothetical protein
MGLIPLPLSSYQTQDLRASVKRLVGCFSEMADQDAPNDARSTVTPAWLRRMAGTRQLTGFGDGSGLPVRGMWEMAGVEYVVIGPNLYEVSLSPITQVATLTKRNGNINIIGFNFVRISDNGACMVILQPGTANAWTYCPQGSFTFTASFATSVMTVTAISGATIVLGQTITGAGIPANTTVVSFGTGNGGVGTYNLSTTPGTIAAETVTATNFAFQTLSPTFFTAQGAIDLWFIDSFIVFLSAALPSTNPNSYGTMTFYNDDGRLVSGNNQITFTTAASFSREFGTDPFIGGTVDHREVMLLGARSSEGYVNTGNPTGTPFSSAPDSFMQIGCHPLCAYSIAKQDQSFFWVAEDKTIRRRTGQTPERVSNSGIENILSTSDLTGCYALTPTVYGHPLWVLTMPNAQRTIVYDTLTKKWFELASGMLNYWRPLSYHNGFGLQLIGDSQSDAVGVLDENTFQEFGATQLCQFVTQGVYSKNDRFTQRRVDLVITMGGTPSPTTPSIVDLYVSDNSGKHFDSFVDPQNLGTQGQDEGTGQRAVWFNLGQSRNRVLMFQVTDPSPLFSVDIQTVLEGGGEIVNYG